MRKLHFAYLLAFAPVLMGADGDTGDITSALIANSLPICTDTQYLTYAGGGLSCREVVGASLNVPDCNKTGQLLTYSKGSEIGVYTCTDKGNGSLSQTDIDLITTTYNKLESFKTTINSLMPGAKGTAATYCGQYTAAQNPNGAISSNGVTGVAAASNLCSQVAACGAGARMCTVYDMYNSVALGKVTSAMTITQSWVHMSSWQHNGGDTANNGLNDNCGGWTYPTADKAWYGTTVEWKAASTGPKALHFASGTGAQVAPVRSPRCSERFPIACCL